MDDFLPFVVSAALHTEVGINQQQGFHGQVFQLQIPGGMVGRDVTDDRHLVAVETKVCIVIMEIRDTSLLVFPAAIFSDVMACRRTGNQCQIHRHPCIIKLSCRMHGHIVDPCHMTQGVKRRNVGTDAHELIQVQTLGHFAQFQILGCKAFFGNFCRRQELHILCRVISQVQHLVAVNPVENLQQPESAFPELLTRPEGFVDFREQSGQGIAVAVLQPAFFRFFRQGRDRVSDGRQNLCRLESAVSLRRLLDDSRHGMPFLLIQFQFHILSADAGFLQEGSIQHGISDFLVQLVIGSHLWFLLLSVGQRDRTLSISLEAAGSCGRSGAGCASPPESVPVLRLPCLLDSS